MSRSRLAVLIPVAALVPLVLFALYNRGQAIGLTFGVWDWRGDGVIAVYGGIGLGLVLMFLFGLPADLAARRERERLARRIAELEREAAVGEESYRSS